LFTQLPLGTGHAEMTNTNVALTYMEFAFQEPSKLINKIMWKNDDNKVET
jgi:hypothetical protein